MNNFWSEPTPDYLAKQRIEALSVKPRKQIIPFILSSLRIKFAMELVGEMIGKEPILIKKV